MQSILEGTKLNSQYLTGECYPFSCQWVNSGPESLLFFAYKIIKAIKQTQNNEVHYPRYCSHLFLSRRCQPCD